MVADQVAGRSVGSAIVPVRCARSAWRSVGTKRSIFDPIQLDRRRIAELAGEEVAVAVPISLGEPPPVHVGALITELPVRVVYGLYLLIRGGSRRNADVKRGLAVTATRVLLYDLNFFKKAERIVEELPRASISVGRSTLHYVCISLGSREFWMAKSYVPLLRENLGVL